MFKTKSDNFHTASQTLQYLSLNSLKIPTKKKLIQEEPSEKHF